MCFLLNSSKIYSYLFSLPLTIVILFLHTIPSTSNVLVNTHKIGNPPPSLDPPPPLPFCNPINTQPSSSHSPQQSNTPFNFPPPNTITTQRSLSQFHQHLPPIPLPFPSDITTQPQAHFSQTFLQTTLSANPQPPYSFPIS